MRLEDKVIVVTGSAGGIGQGLVSALLEDGAMVVMTDLDQGRLDAAAAQLDPGRQRTVCVPGNLLSGDDVASIVDAAAGAFGRLDGLVNNAGAIVMDAAFDATVDDWSMQLDVNATAAFAMAQCVGHHMRENGGGSIVNVASNCGKDGYDNMAAYNASKAAVISMTRSLAREWAQVNINVNAVCPGGVDTPMLASVADWLAPRVGVDADEILSGMKVAQLGRKIQPIEVGRVVAFLLSDDATIIRGQSISVDGGDTAY